MAELSDTLTPRDRTPALPLRLSSILAFNATHFPHVHWNKGSKGRAKWPHTTQRNQSPSLCRDIALKVSPSTQYGQRTILSVLRRCGDHSIAKVIASCYVAAIIATTQKLTLATAPIMTMRVPLPDFYNESRDARDREAAHFGHVHLNSGSSGIAL